MFQMKIQQYLRSCSSDLVTNAWVEPAVKEIYGQVGDDHDDGNEHDEVLNHGIVAPQNRVDEITGHTGKVEDGFCDHQTSNHKGKLNADHGNHGKSGITQCVAADDDPLALSLRPGRSNVVLTEHIEHRRARDAHNQRGAAVAYCESGKEKLQDVGFKIFKRRDVGHRRNPSEIRD